MTLRALVAAAAVLVLVASGCLGPERAEEGSGSTGDLLLDEGFDGPLDLDRWNTCHWWSPDGCTIETNDELEWYRPEQVAVDDGALRLTAVAEPITVAEGTFPFRSGMVTTGRPDAETRDARFAFTYGRVEARIRVPAVDGTWPAVWLLPVTNESLPEIDVLEAYGQAPDEAQMTLHDADGGRRRREATVADLSEGWHTVAVDWRPGRLVWSVDGVVRFTVTGADVPDEPMYLVLNLAVGGPAGEPAPDDEFPATFAVDRVRVWAA